MTMNDRNRWLALIVLCLGTLMIVLDTTIVNVALPSIRTDLHFSQTSLAWVVNAYLLTFGGFLLRGGRLGGLAGVDDDALHRARRAREGDGHLRVRRVGRRRDRRPARRGSHELARLALDLPRQPAHRRNRGPALAPASPERARGTCEPEARRCGRRDGHRGADPRGLRDRQRQHRRLDVGADARSPRRCGGAARALRLRR